MPVWGDAFKWRQRLDEDRRNPAGLLHSGPMKNWMATLAVALVLAASPAGAQWRNLPKDQVPAGPDGKPNMSAATPRTASGRPDLSGIYSSNYKYFQNLAADLGLENVPMTDAARKIQAARATGLLGYEEPDAHCLPQGVPKIDMAPVPFRIVQTDRLVILSSPRPQALRSAYG